ncbi:AAA family ATPase [uncultured Agrobacterium sp.]|uniref:AAA family ATPase n=1 Tax=uncultured Agrobacterium sp. TaxID=157277 RepID=UPI00258A20A4|nr:AAA family ATPase [uncultured Agrobacterium sp.]
MKKLRLHRLELQNVSRFASLDVNFSDQLNVICGTNGIGKTTILESIASSLVTSSMIKIRRRADSISLGRVTAQISVDGVEINMAANLREEDGTFNSFPFGYGPDPNAIRYLMYLKASRDFPYIKSDTINADPQRQDHELQNHAVEGINAFDVKKWLSNRYLFRAFDREWPAHRKENYELAKKAFSFLDERVSLAKIDSTTFDVLVNTPSGVIPYEFLSSGFRAIYAIILGLIKEIEYRRLETSAKDFAGLILIDEIELHLHPSWQRSVTHILKSVFPSAQIIITTHSPHVVQSCDAKEVLPLIEGPHGPTVRTIDTGPYGFKGWSLEEILENVMGLDDVFSPEYRSHVKKFDQALDRGHAELARHHLKELELMLHPSSPLRKILRIQAAPLIGMLHDQA